MPLYGFILGRTHLLSVAELCALFSKIKDIQEETLIIESDKALTDPQKLQDRLGGTIKICEIVQTLPNPEYLQPGINSLLKEHFAQADSKVRFGLSAYNLAKNYEKILKNLLKNSKKFLKSIGINNRFVNKTCAKLSSVQVALEKLIGKKGLEINIIQGHDKIYLGQTITVQNFAAYSQRDYEKPGRDARSGMLPPKIAQIMINLAGPAETIIDPFCGTGTILMEAALMNKNVLGSDLNPKAVTVTQKNLKWLQSICHPDRPRASVASRGEAEGSTSPHHNTLKNPTFQVTLKDATELTLPNENLTIVTEPYLGPPLLHPPTEEKITEIQTELKDLYLRFFTNLKKTVPKDTVIVIIFPYIKSTNKKHFLNLTPEIEKLGFQARDLIPPDIQTKFGLELSQHKSLLYERKDQIVGREIWKFTLIST